MRLRERIGIVAATTVAIAVAIAVIASYFIVRGQLTGQLDGELRAQATLTRNASLPFGAGLPQLSASAGGATPYAQAVLPNGVVGDPVGGIPLPQVSEAAMVAAGSKPAYFSNVEVRGARLRMYTFATLLGTPFAGQTSVAIQLARPLAVVDNVLRKLRWILAVVFLAVVALAALLARVATRRVLRPLAEVTATAETIAQTEDLQRRIEVHQHDEIGQLATRFNEMLERLAASRRALDASVSAQRQLVADASHELRTPVTSLRTNIEVLLAETVLSDAERRQLLADVVEQSEELTTLVADLIEVARGDVPSGDFEDVRLDRLVEAALERTRRNAPGVTVTARLAPLLVQGNSERLTRAINNLLDNAVRHTAAGTPIEVALGARGLTVRDHGAGISARDLPHVFDRFYRGDSSRARQGSGLGLAIVRQVAEQHGGSISADNAPGGGAIFTLSLPGVHVEDPVDTTVS